MSNIAEIKLKINILNILEILGIQLSLLLALGFQIFLHDVPCPLCLLQRAGFFGIVIGLLMNLRFGLHPRHYSITLLSAVFTSYVALRQIILNIAPDGGFGNPFLGLHLYTWSFIISNIILLFTAFMLGIYKQFKPVHNMCSHWSTYVLLAITTVIFIINFVLLLFK